MRPLLRRRARDAERRRPLRRLVVVGVALVALLALAAIVLGGLRRRTDGHARPTARQTGPLRATPRSA